MWQDNYTQLESLKRTLPMLPVFQLFTDKAKYVRGIFNRSSDFVDLFHGVVLLLLSISPQSLGAFFPSLPDPHPSGFRGHRELPPLERVRRCIAGLGAAHQERGGGVHGSKPLTFPLKYFHSLLSYRNRVS